MTGFSVNTAMLLLLMYTSPLSLAVASTSKVSCHVILTPGVVSHVIPQIIIQAFVAAALFGNRMNFTVSV